MVVASGSKSSSASAHAAFVPASGQRRKAVLFPLSTCDYFRLTAFAFVQFVSAAVIAVLVVAGRFTWRCVHDCRFGRHFRRSRTGTTLSFCLSRTTDCGSPCNQRLIPQFLVLVPLSTTI